MKNLRKKRSQRKKKLLKQTPGTRNSISKIPFQDYKNKIDLKNKIYTNKNKITQKNTKNEQQRIS